MSAASRVSEGRPVAEVRGLVKRFSAKGPPALDDIDLTVSAGTMTGLAGPDGAGKTTLIRCLAGLLTPQEGEALVNGLHVIKRQEEVHKVISYMPQQFGLYEDLSVLENLRLQADLRGVTGEERDKTFPRLLDFTGLEPFTGRLAGRLSGGMKQKLGLACALLAKPDLLLLDEPSVGVDPVSRRDLWQMVRELAGEGMAVVWSTAYLDEAERCGQVLVLQDGRPLYLGDPAELTARVRDRVFRLTGVPASQRRSVLAEAMARDDVVDGVIQGRAIRLVMAEEAEPPESGNLGAESGQAEAVKPRFEDAFVDALGGGASGRSPLAETVQERRGGDEAIIVASDLTRRFGDFTAASKVTFQVAPGEVFGLLGPNGAGKSTTFKMLCGLLPPTEGEARVAGWDLAASPSKARARIGYMAQKFSLYGVMTCAQNLDFFSRVYGLRGKVRRKAVGQMADIFALGPMLNRPAGALPLGFKQRLALACCLMHRPDALFLDEPTSGVDPITRREFWSHINAMAEKGVAVMVTTHFLDEAEYCDRVGLMYRGEVIALGSPAELKDQAADEDNPDPTLEDAFIHHIRRVEAEHDTKEAA
ncbi:ATP-binding cassette domain-containing protein [Desulfohalovibrio reitneri]|uniref:ATP-binding cassette domain-containing protein n=1 Tax=Desulfohalovibrio reitneri TaxID=1307759 RepID=UPI0004A75E53|nr:ATP-binding cassette domain-containing protein [Desulfohalovibrio reitneri]